MAVAPLQKRMNPSLPSVIRSSQLCTVGDRNILFGVSNILSSIFHASNKKRKGCLMSLDFYKAYDRVVLDYLLRVMTKMKFSATFRNWIKMLHNGAQTKFILTRLTEAINVNFSIRQGDPLAMLLYILYVEPLLLYLERNLKGMNILDSAAVAGNPLNYGISEKLEAFCDDVNILTEHLSDIIKVDQIVSEFEIISGAILSRSKKCKIIGFGQWKQRKNWPVDYVQTEEELKVFGIIIRDSYRALIRRNWEYRYSKFNGCLQSWSSRSLISLSSRVEVLKIFALSRVFYVAAILPITQTFIHKFEASMGKFIWNASGWLLRVSMEEIKNVKEKGGLSLTCIESMCSSLLLSQFLRLLKSSDLNTIAHVDYWIGDTLTDLLPSLDKAMHATDIHDYFCHMESLVVAARIDELITPQSWKRLSNKKIYLDHTKTFPVPKVEIASGPDFDYKFAWQRINSTVLTSSIRDISFLLLHNKLPLKERLFRVALSTDPYCNFCPGAEVCDVEHFFCNCIRVNAIWSRIKIIITSLIKVNLSDWIIINYLLPRTEFEDEITWLLGNYIAKAWSDLFARNTVMLKEEEFFGFLSFKFKDDQRGARKQMRVLHDFL